MSKEKENDVLINFNGTKYKAEDLTEKQLNIAGKLNVAQRQLQDLQRAYENYIIAADYKELQIKAFAETIEEEAKVVKEE
jgi:hypothetical protein